MRSLRALLALPVLLVCAPVQARELPPTVLTKVRAAARGDRLGVWEFADHLKEGHIEAGYSMNTDNIIVSVKESAGRKYYVLGGSALRPHSIISVPEKGEIQVRSSRDASAEDWRKFMRVSLGEKGAAARPVKVAPLR